MNEVRILGIPISITSKSRYLFGIMVTYTCAACGEWIALADPLSSVNCPSGAHHAAFIIRGQ